MLDDSLLCSQWSPVDGTRWDTMGVAGGFGVLGACPLARALSGTSLVRASRLTVQGPRWLRPMRICRSAPDPSTAVGLPPEPQRASTHSPIPSIRLFLQTLSSTVVYRGMGKIQSLYNRTYTWSRSQSSSYIIYFSSIARSRLLYQSIPKLAATSSPQNYTWYWYYQSIGPIAFPPFFPSICQPNVNVGW